MKENDFGNQIQKVAKELQKQGFPAKTSAYAAAMGYLRSLKKK